jgi:hypothetical protein
VPGAFEVFVIANEATSAPGTKFLLVSLFYDRASLTPLRGWSEIEAKVGPNRAPLVTLRKWPIPAPLRDATAG